MKIAFPCESCGYRFEVDGSLAGKKCKCKQCGHVFVIPVPRQSSQPSPKPVKTYGGAGSSSSSTSRPGAKPARPAPPPAFDPYYDDDDPYASGGLAAPGPGSRSQPAAHEDEEFLPPRGPKPYANGAVKKKKKRSDGSAVDEAPWWVLKVGGALTLASALVCLLSLQTGLILVSVFYFATSFILLCMGGIGMAVVPFMESAVCGLMNLFVPIYPLYYLITRWDDMKRWFLTYLVGFCLLVPGFFFVVGLPAVEIVRDAAEAARLRAEIDAAGPNDPRRAEREAEFARLQARLNGHKQFGDTVIQQPQVETIPEPFVAPAPMDPPFTAPEANFTPKAADPPPFESQPFVPRSDGFDVPEPAANPPRAVAPEPAPAPLSPTDPNFFAKTLSDLKAPSPLLRKGALAGLKNASVNESRRAEIARAVEPLLGDPDSACRVEAARALATWGSKENTPALVKAIKDPDVGVRGAAIETIGALKDPSAAEEVAAHLTDTRDQAGAALRTMGRAAEPAVIKYLTHDDIWVRAEACKVLEEIGGSEECKVALVKVVERANNFGFDADAANSALQKIGMPNTGEDK